MSLYGMMRAGVSGMNAESTPIATVADNIASSGTSYVSGSVSTQVNSKVFQIGSDLMDVLVNLKR